MKNKQLHYSFIEEMSNVTDAVGDISKLSKWDNVDNLSKIDNLSKTGDKIGDISKIGDKIDNIGDINKTGNNLGNVADTGGKLTPLPNDFGKIANNPLDKPILPPIGSSVSVNGNSIKVAENTDNVIDSAKGLKDFDGSEQVAKGLDNNNGIGVEAKLNTDDANAFNQSVDEIAKADLKTSDKVLDWMKSNKKTVGLTALVATIIAGIAIASAVKTDKINNTDYKIINIKNSGSFFGNKITISYTPLDKFTENDTIVVSNADSVPVINGALYNIEEYGKGYIVLKTDFQLNKEGTNGILKCSTSFGTQFTNTAKEVTVTPIVDTISTSAGSLASGTLSGILKPIATYWWIIVLCIILFFSSIVTLFLIR